MKIKYGLYQITGNDDLIEEAKYVLSNPLPNDYCDKHDAFRETASILDRIIKDRSDKIDLELKDFIGKRQLENLVDLNCEFILDKETEIIIDQLFKREEKIHSIKPNPNYRFVKIIKEEK